jgi:hypothetical protein
MITMITRLCIVMLLVVVMFCGQALAQDKSSGQPGARDKNIGIGVILGEPTGVCGKWWVTDAIAIDAAVAWSFVADESIQVHADALYHIYNIIKVKKGKLPLYAGVGARVNFEVNENENENRFGIRVPVGIDYIFAEKPLDIFFELVPILEVSPSVRVSFNAAVGIRYYFW